MPMKQCQTTYGKNEPYGRANISVDEQQGNAQFLQGLPQKFPPLIGRRVAKMEDFMGAGHEKVHSSSTHVE